MHKPMVAALGVAPGSICHHLQVLHGPQDVEDDSEPEDDVDFFTPLIPAYAIG
jgi:hypothetical protein